MKKSFYGVALISSLVLTACSDGPAEPKIPGSGDGSTKFIAPVYAPGDGEIPVPNDLLFSGSADLTLNIPSADPTDMSDPQNAISGLDGWSTHAPFNIEFRGAIDASTILPGQTVRVFKVSTARGEVAPGIPGPTGPVTGVEAELAAGSEFVAVPNGSAAIGIVPLVPFDAQASYMVVVTNGVTDVNGNSVIADTQFAIAKSPDPIPEGSATSALEPVRQLVNAMLGAAEGAGVARDDVVLAYQFTVQSVADSIVASQGFYVDGNSPFSTAGASSFSTLMTDTTPFTGIGAANLYKGEFSLPYILTAPSMESPTAPLDKQWVGADMVPDGQGGMMANPFAGGNITYANPLPQKSGDETVPLLVSLPKNPQCPKPYPVMIFQHGITSDRTAMLGIADTMASACTAVVSMDLPLHGIAADNQVHLGLQQASGGQIGIFAGYSAGAARERTFGVDYVDNDTSAPGPDGIADSSGAHFINLQNLLVSRDNVRQGVLDLLALENEIPNMDVDGDTIPDFDGDKISFMGHSLGGIVGSDYLALSANVQQGVLATTSGSIAQLLNGSPTFGPVIRAGLSASTGIPESDPAFATEVLAPFMFAAQTVVDSADPVNYAKMAVAQNKPTLGIQIQGDTVVTNQVDGAPLAGNTPHAALYGLPVVTETTNAARGSIKVSIGTHATPLTPAGPDSSTQFMDQTTLIQNAIAKFIGSGGTLIEITDPTLIEE
ncbi:lipase [Kangiella japonica]|uniref:Lipase n=1 Tax=Kangiella japonica TaxID=647384 RepID=A0ABN0SW83_9GAMM